MNFIVTKFPTFSRSGSFCILYSFTTVLNEKLGVIFGAILGRLLPQPAYQIWFDKAVDKIAAMRKTSKVDIYLTFILHFSHIQLGLFVLIFSSQ